jgi:hypothetical protein
MDIQHHKHTHHKKWTQYIWDFFLLFLAITLSFFVENRREHFIEHKRLKKYLINVQQDVKSNITSLDSLILSNSIMLGTYDSLLVELLKDPVQVDRFEYAKKIFPVFMRLFKNRKETFDQLIMTGSLRYLDNQNLLNAVVGYNRLADMTEWRAMENERKMALEQNYPVIYEIFDAHCLLLDIPGKKADFSHTDILTGVEAKEFCMKLAKELISRIRFMRLSYDTYRMLKTESQNLDGLLEKFLH